MSHQHAEILKDESTESKIGSVEKLCDKMKLHLQNGGKLNPDHWEEDEPCYGSDAYCDAYGF